MGPPGAGSRTCACTCACARMCIYAHTDAHAHADARARMLPATCVSAPPLWALPGLAQVLPDQYKSAKHHNSGEFAGARRKIGNVGTKDYDDREDRSGKINRPTMGNCMCRTRTHLSKTSCSCPPPPPPPLSPPRTQHPQTRRHHKKTPTPTYTPHAPHDPHKAPQPARAPASSLDPTVRTPVYSCRRMVTSHAPSPAHAPLRL